MTTYCAKWVLPGGRTFRDLKAGQWFVVHSRTPRFMYMKITVGASAVRVGRIRGAPDGRACSGTLDNTCAGEGSAVLVGEDDPVYWVIPHDIDYDLASPIPVGERDEDE